MGTLAPAVNAEPFVAMAEGNGSIPLTDETGLSGSGSSTTTEATIGDGPHGSDGDANGDFDFYAVRGAAAGQRLLVDIDTPASELDSVVVLYDAEGNAIADNDDEGSSFDSLLNFVLPADGDYYVSVDGRLPDRFQEDPFHSGFGFRDFPGSQGDYSVTFGLDSFDVDTYAVNLRAGDVLGGSVAGSGSVLNVNDPAGREVHGSAQDASCIYPASSPLPGGGHAVVGPRRRAQRAPLRDRDRLRGALRRHACRSTARGPEALERDRVQMLFLDFDGAAPEYQHIRRPGRTATLSASGRSSAVGDISGVGQENDVLQRSRSSTPWSRRTSAATTPRGERVFACSTAATTPTRSGSPNVSRLIVGGTISQSGIPTIGIAQSIDPGNFETEETALVLFDVVSDPATADDPETRSVVQRLPQGRQRPGEVRRHGPRQRRVARGGPLHRELPRRPVQRHAEPDGPGRELPAALGVGARRHRRHRRRPGRRLRQDFYNPARASRGSRTPRFGRCGGCTCSGRRDPSVAAPATWAAAADAGPAGGGRVAGMTTHLSPPQMIPVIAAAAIAAALALAAPAGARRRRASPTPRSSPPTTPR